MTVSHHTTIESLRFEDLGFKFEDAEGHLYKNLNVEFPLNDIVAVSSLGGRGKSTLLKLMAGIILPSSGHYYINDLPVEQMSFEEFLPFRFKIGYSFDFGGLISNKTINDNLTLPLMYHNICKPQEVARLVDEMVQIFNLSSVLNQRPSGIAGSLRKAALIARTFIMNPELLLLDDPTTGLAAETKEKLVRLILQRRKSGQIKHVFIASDDVRFLNAIAATKMTIGENDIKFEEYIIESLYQSRRGAM